MFPPPKTTLSRGNRLSASILRDIVLREIEPLSAATVYFSPVLRRGFVY